MSAGYIRIEIHADGFGEGRTIRRRLSCSEMHKLMDIFVSIARLTERDEKAK